MQWVHVGGARAAVASPPCTWAARSQPQMIGCVRGASGLSRCCGAAAGSCGAALWLDPYVARECRRPATRVARRAAEPRRALLRRG
eukprot:COSAG01_NODE_3975_length_5476_cov_11.325646_2_plen_86_part_00